MASREGTSASGAGRTAAAANEQLKMARLDGATKMPLFHRRAALWI